MSESKRRIERVMERSRVCGRKRKGDREKGCREGEADREK